ncbi:MAG: hypothetical protein WCA06_00510 [Terrimicrobiaceae bacterium]
MVTLSDDIAQRCAEEFLGEVAWQTRDCGFCACPGEHLHTHQTAEGHCSVFVATENGIAPGVYCFHGSCAAVVAERSAALRKALGRLFVSTGVASAGGGSACTFTPGPPRPPRIPDPVFVLEAGKKFAAGCKDEITPEWLAARSPVCPWNRTPTSFLHALYRPGEKVVVFDEYVSQGQARNSPRGIRSPLRLAARSRPAGR